MTAHPAVLFDVDGTLVDTNYLHVHAWLRAFADEDLLVQAWRVHRCIGMDGTSLIHDLCPDVSDETEERLKKLHTLLPRVRGTDAAVAGRTRALARSR